MYQIKYSFLTGHSRLLDGIVLGKDGHAIVKDFILMILDERGANAQTFLPRTGGGKADGTHAVVHQLACQLATGHVTVTDGEVETVGNGLVTIHTVNDAEAVAGENLFQLVSSLTVHDDVVTEVVLAVAGSAPCCGCGPSVGCSF